MCKIIIIFVIFLHIANGYGMNVVSSSSNNNENHNPNIIGGVDAPERYAKYMVALVINNYIKVFVCGGSIVTKRHILTAAHCIKRLVILSVIQNTDFVGVIGSNYWNSSDKIIKFSGYINHPEYEGRYIKNDIGFLFTAEDIVFNDRVSPIKLNFNWIGSDASSLVTGWGLYKNMASIPDRLQLLYVNTISPLTCIIRVRITAISWDMAPPVNPLLEICTLHSRGHGMCNGDSGSALVLQDSREQIGIVSWGFPCALGAPDVFVRISGLKDFILSVIGGLYTGLKY